MHSPFLDPQPYTAVECDEGKGQCVAKHAGLVANGEGRREGETESQTSDDDCCNNMLQLSWPVLLLNPMGVAIVPGGG